MAELAKGPKDKDSGIAKYRITSGGAHNTAEYKGKVYTRDGEEVSSLGAEDLAALDADPKFVVERFNAKGQLVNKQGQPYKGLPPPAKEKAEPKPAKSGDL